MSDKLTLVSENRLRELLETESKLAQAERERDEWKQAHENAYMLATKHLTDMQEVQDELRARVEQLSGALAKLERGAERHTITLRDVRDIARDALGTVKKTT